MRILYSLITIGAAAMLSANAPQICTCLKTPSPKKIIRPQSTPPQSPFIQEITLQCGIHNSGKPIDDPTKPISNDDSHRSNPGLSWDKIIESIVKLIASLAWPLASILIAYNFKKELTELLSRIKRGRIGSAEFEFEAYVKQVDADSDIPRTEEESITPSAAARASTDPRGAIVTSWIEVEDALLNLVRSRELKIPVSSSKSQLNVISAIRAIQHSEILDTPYIALFHDLRAMRNEAAHAVDFNPTADAVFKYIQLAKELKTVLRSLAIQG